MKIQTKTALLFTFLTAGIILSLSFAVYYFSSRYTFNDFLKRLELRARIASKIHFEENEISTAAFNELRKQYLTALPQEKEYILQYDIAVSKVISEDSLKLPAYFYRRIAGKEGTTEYYKAHEIQYAGILYRHNGQHYLIISSAVNEYGNQALLHLREVLLFTFIAAIVIVFSVGLLFSRKMFEPVRNITSRVKDISSHNLHLRLQAGNGKDEMIELAQTFNDMLDRLETAFETQNNFVSNASHELRTPLTTIIGEAEIAISRPRPEAEYRQSLETILQQSLRLQHVTDSLLKLAQAGFDGQKQQWGILRADELLWTVKQTVDEINPDNHISISLHMPDDEQLASVQGNYQLLNLALSNIVLNACKYSDNKQVNISLATGAGKIVVTIMDEGIGIPAAELKYIFDPFFRASNSNRYEGHGIGLPLTHTIVRLHKGDIKFVSEVGKGTTVIVTLPAA
jgi:signal transduction histidine kinase